jgi:hypothetical protein
MSEINFKTFDDDVDTQAPELDGPGEYLIEVRNIKVFKTRKAGQAFIAEYVVRESSHKGSPVGSIRAFRQFDTEGTVWPESKGIKQRNVRGFIAACAGADPKSSQKWGEIVEYAAKKNIFGQNAQGKSGLLRDGAGVLVRCKTQKPKPGRSGNMFVEHAFSPNVEE